MNQFSGFTIASLSLLFVLFGCKENTSTFELMSPEYTGIEFINDVQEYDSFNILNSEFIYNGAGVAIGDLNNDGLEDLYFAGNQVGNVCYLNVGDLKFKDITQAAGVQKKPGQWSSGVQILDLTGDGWNDIYVCNTLIRNAEKRKNLFFVNKGLNNFGIPVFEEKASVYGLDDTSHASHAQFLDYDRDGDLDLFVGTNYIDKSSPSQFVKDFNASCDQNCDKLYRNDWDSVAGHPKFVDVSIQAGFAHQGYSHSTLIHDFNKDGWPDIYVANDYLSDDLIYINNKNGTFSNQAGKIFRHQSSSAMGSDLGDINNDGTPEIMTVEMLPFTNLRKKTLIGPANYSSYVYIQQYGYQYQYTRNTLQWNQGMVNGYPVYSDISFLSGVHETEWSWAPLFADMNLDGYEDLYITNGFPKDVTDHDFGEYRIETSNLISEMDLQNVIPVVKVSNFMFNNHKDLTFTDVTSDWGMNIKSFSNGAAYGDLDNDGDPDLVVHNIDDVPFVFKNNTISKSKSKDKKHYIRVSLKGTTFNPAAIGSTVQVHLKSGIQTRYILTGRGYLSQSSYTCLFGLDTAQTIDSILVFWPDGTRTKSENIKADQTLKIIQNTGEVFQQNTMDQTTLFKTISSSGLGLEYKHKEKDFIDFNIQKTLPHKLSQQGVPMVAGDVNGDGWEDLIVGSSAGDTAVLFYQNHLGLFTKQNILLKEPNEIEAEDAGMILFDADADSDLDLMISGGSYENLMANKSTYGLRFFQNDGHGRFTRDTHAIKSTWRTCSSTLRCADIDADGDLDVFVAGHVLPGYYPKPDISFLLVNETQNGKVVFSDGTSTWGKALLGLSYINDALFTDFNNDSKPDLILATGWGPITLLKNTGTQFELIQNKELNGMKGWWTSLASGDFDNDGDMDYLCGNFGDNIYFKCSQNEPITIYAKDFDSNGSLDPFISCFWRDTSGKKREYFFHGRDEMIKQLLLIKRKFQNYTSFGLATVQEVFTGDELKGAMVLKTNTLTSMLLTNEGSDIFNISELPKEAQMAPLYGIQIEDLNQDGFLDAIVGGNDYGMELIQGRADAMHGLVLINNKTGGFDALRLNHSGYYTPGESKSLTIVNSPNLGSLFVQMTNLDSLKLHTLNGLLLPVTLDRNEMFGTIHLPSGQRRRFEQFSQFSYKAQKSNTIWIPQNSEVIIENALTKTRRTIRK